MEFGAMTDTEAINALRQIQVSLAEAEHRHKKQMTLFADTKYLELLEAIAEAAYQFGETKLDKYRRELINLAEVYKEYHGKANSKNR